MSAFLQFIFFAVLVRPLLMLMLGMNVRRRALLPQRGPAVIVANHNSHLDVLALMTLFPLRRLRAIRPVAAHDYFMRKRWLAWFSTNIMHIIPIERRVKAATADPLAGLERALEAGEIVIVFPEGSRGEPEKLGEFKSGVAHLARRRPEVPFYPIYMHGLGKALPRGEALLVPFFCDVFVGEPLTWRGDKQQFMEEITQRMNVLAGEGHFQPWD